MTTDWAIAGAVRHWAGRKPDTPCIGDDGGTLTWQQFYDRSCRLGQGLLAGGLEPGDRVVYLGRNRTEFFEILVGAATAGVVTAAVNWRLLPAETQFIIHHCQAKVLFVEAEFAGRAATIRADLPLLEAVVVIGASDAVEGADYEVWLAAQPTEDPNVAMGPDDIAFQMYTSGTTGLPKSAMFSNAAVQATGAMASVINVDETSVLLVAMPVFHAAGSSLGILGLNYGAELVIAREVLPERLLALIEQRRVTMSTLVPAVLKMLLETPAVEHTDLSSLDTIAYAASPISPVLLRAAIERFRCKFVQIYGMTETNGVTALYPEDHLDPAHPERMMSGGRALPGVTLRVVDALTGQDAPEGEFGEVWIKAPTNMLGYWDAPDETAATVTPDGFVRSGDGGYLSQGYLYLKDRIKDMIVSGAENIYPIEVENVLLTHPCIDDVAVIGVASPKWGETVKAVVVRHEGVFDLTEADVIHYAKQHLAGYKCPTSVEFVSELPRNPSGKILKRVLRQAYAG